MNAKSGAEHRIFLRCRGHQNEQRFRTEKQPPQWSKANSIEALPSLSDRVPAALRSFSTVARDQGHYSAERGAGDGAANIQWLEKLKSFALNGIYSF